MAAGTAAMKKAAAAKASRVNDLVFIWSFPVWVLGTRLPSNSLEASFILARNFAGIATARQLLEKKAL